LFEFSEKLFYSQLQSFGSSDRGAPCFGAEAGRRKAAWADSFLDLRVGFPRGVGAQAEHFYFEFWVSNS
jgi:hypothetical protein